MLRGGAERRVFPDDVADLALVGSEVVGADELDGTALLGYLLAGGGDFDRPCPTQQQLQSWNKRRHKLKKKH